MSSNFRCSSQLSNPSAVITPLMTTYRILAPTSPLPLQKKKKKERERKKGGGGEGKKKIDLDPSSLYPLPTLFLFLPMVLFSPRPPHPLPSALLYDRPSLTPFSFIQQERDLTSGSPKETRKTKRGPEKWELVGRSCKDGCSAKEI